MLHKKIIGIILFEHFRDFILMLKKLLTRFLKFGLWAEIKGVFKVGLGNESLL